MKLRITVDNEVFEVDVEILEEAGAAVPAPRPASAPKASTPAAPAPAAAESAPAAAPVAAGGNTFPAPIAGTIRMIKVKPGDQVAVDQEIMILEAMKMETSVNSSQAGTIKAVLVKEGDAVQSGQALVEFA